MIFAILTLLAALAVAGVAGWFSIIGVMAIYAGAPYHAALVMGMILEFAKLVTTSWIYRNWEFANWKLKAPLIYFTAALMLVTSIGVFGFLSKSHLEQGAKTIDNGPRIERLDQQIAREKSIIADNEKVIAQLDATINSYLGKDRTDKSVSIRKNQAPQRQQLKDEIDAANKRINGFSEEKFKLQSEIRAMELEVGPIRYIAELMYGSENNSTRYIEAAVKIFTLLIVSTLDPLAVILLVAANHTIMRHQNEKNKKTEKNEYINQVHNVGSNKEGFIRTKESGIPDILSGENKSNDKISEMVVSIQEEPVELVNEDEKTIIIKGEKGEEHLQESSSGDLHSTPSTNACKIPEEKSMETTDTNTEETVFQDINVEENATLKKFPSSFGHSTLALVRSPIPSMVSKIDTKISASIDTDSETKIQPSPSQSDSLSNLRWKSHFIPQKINEEEKLSQMEISSHGEEEAAPRRPPPEIIEMYRIGQEKDQVSENLEEKDIIGDHARTDRHKYPRALSWLKEFTRTRNE